MDNQLQQDIQNIQFAINLAPMVWADQVNVRQSLERIVKALTPQSPQPETEKKE